MHAQLPTPQVVNLQPGNKKAETKNYSSTVIVLLLVHICFRFLFLLAGFFAHLGLAAVAVASQEGGTTRRRHDNRRMSYNEQSYGLSPTTGGGDKG